MTGTGLRVFSLGNDGVVAVIVSTDGEVIINVKDKLLVHPPPRHQEVINSLSDAVLGKFLKVFFSLYLNDENGRRVLFIDASDDDELALSTALAYDMALDLASVDESTGYSIKRMDSDFWVDFSRAFPSIQVN
jgi:hypothetical protein